MSDPIEAQIEAFLKKPRREQLDILVKASTTHTSSIWLTPTTVQALLMRFLIESSHRPEGFSKVLIWLTACWAS
jgi:hypothetical protein